MEAYPNDNNVTTVYMALFNTSWFLKHRPFFSFLNAFSTSERNPVAQSFRLAHELHGCINIPTKFNNILDDIEGLIQYKNNWFRKLFFPKELSDALNIYQEDTQLLPLCKALANNTNTWFFPTLNLLGQIPLIQAYRKFEDSFGKSVDPSEQSLVFDLVASSDTPLEQFEIIRRFHFSRSRKDIDLKEMKTWLDWHDKYPTLEISYLLQLEHKVSDKTISAILNLSDDYKRKAIEGLFRLPDEFLDDASYIDAIIKHAQPDIAALTLSQFHKNNLLDTESDKNFCLGILKENESKGYNNPVLDLLRSCLEKLTDNTQFTVQDKLSIVKHSKSLFSSLTDVLWNAVPYDLLYKSYQALITICTQNDSQDPVSDIIGYFLAIPAVFYSVNVQCSSVYDRYTKPQIDQ